MFDSLVGSNLTQIGSSDTPRRFARHAPSIRHLHTSVCRLRSSIRPLRSSIHAYGCPFATYAPRFAAYAH
eukprot:5356993-Pyramimonas_sp.AAC.1